MPISASSPDHRPLRIRRTRNRSRIRSTRRPRFAAAGLVAVVAGVAVLAGAVGAGARRRGRAGSCVISVPNVEWADVAEARTPNLDRLFRGVGHRRISPSGSSGRPRRRRIRDHGRGRPRRRQRIDRGLGFDVDEPFGPIPPAWCSDPHRLPPGDGLVYLPMAAAARSTRVCSTAPRSACSATSSPRTEVSAPSSRTATARDPSPPETRYSPCRRSRRRLMTGDGKVPGGRVDDDPAQPDPAAPFGRPLDDDAVVQRVHAAWSAASVGAPSRVSDLVARRPVATRLPRPTSRRESGPTRSRATDGLVGRLLGARDDERRGPRRGLRAAGRTRWLSVAAVRAPGFGPGCSGRRPRNVTGFVNVTDVAPTVLTYSGSSVPTRWRGDASRPATPVRRSPTGATFLANVNEDGLFRDRLVGASMGVVVGRHLRALGLAAAAGRPVVAPAVGRRACVAFARVWSPRRTSTRPTWPARCPSVATVGGRRTGRSSSESRGVGRRLCLVVARSGRSTPCSSVSGDGRVHLVDL